MSALFLAQGGLQDKGRLGYQKREDLKKTKNNQQKNSQ
jgi:hypothetical protein